jgi:hypothetical protein
MSDMEARTGYQDTGDSAVLSLPVIPQEGAATKFIEALRSIGAREELIEAAEKAGPAPAR